MKCSFVSNSKNTWVQIRRRVGKTYLIRQTFGDKFIFEHAGLADGGMKDQLQAFTASLRRFGLDVDDIPTNWIDAFELLKDLIIRSRATARPFLILFMG